jgi:hypothetical protein
VQGEPFLQRLDPLLGPLFERVLGSLPDPTPDSALDLALLAGEVEEREEQVEGKSDVVLLS